MKIEVKKITHPFEKTKEDFLVKGAYHELVLMLKKHVESAASPFDLERSISNWERDNVKAGCAPTQSILDFFHQELRRSSGDVSSVLNSLKLAKSKWLP